MSAYELMLSESQERMLLVVEKGHEAEVQEIFEKWDLHAEIIGRVEEGDRLVVTYKDKVVADVPAQSLVLGGGAPVYTRESKEPEYLKETRSFDPAGIPVPGDLNGVLLRLLRSPNITSKRWVYEQYDSMVRTNNMTLTQSDAALSYVKGTDKALALTTDCNGRYVYLNPKRGAMIAVAEAARNIVCSGGLPLAITNCLNFGNPYKPEIYWQFKEAVAGMGEACRAFDTPVTGGNVSFYNESPLAGVYPTPVIGMVGLVEKLEHATTACFKKEDDIIFLLGETRGHVGGSEYLSVIHSNIAGEAPEIDLMAEKNLHAACLEGIRKGIIQSAHDCSEGGLAVALAESCVIREGDPLGATVRLNEESLRPDFLLFGEDQGRILVSLLPEQESELRHICRAHDVPVKMIGTVGGDSLVISDWISLSCREVGEAFHKALGHEMELAL
jgi:phosphoribosylformylglycinamidine synthase